MLARDVLRLITLDALAYDPARLRAYQERQLRALVRTAYEQVPFYRARFERAGVHPDAIRTLDDLSRIPLLTKQDLRTAPLRARLARNVREEDCFLAETSGSTGEPMQMYKDRDALFSIAAWASPVNITRWVGARVYRVMTLLVRDARSLEAGLVRYLPRAMLRVHEGDALAEPEMQLAQLEQYRPHLLITYPSVLRTLALLVKRRGMPVHQPRVVAVTAEVFDPSTRALATEVFPRAALHNGYGATETGLIALECAYHRGLHVAGTQAIVELLHDGRPVPPGVPGDVVITDLTNFAAPLLRYAGLGDIASWSPARCPCGRTLPVLEVIEGRRVDSFVLPDGRIVHPYTLTLSLEHIAGVERFQIVQEALDRVRVLIMGPAGDGAASRERAVAAVRAILGSGVSISIEPVRDLPRGPGPSARTVRSLIST